MLAVNQLRATRGACNPNLQVVITHQAVACMQPALFGLPLYKNKWNAANANVVTRVWTFYLSQFNHACFDRLSRETYANHSVCAKSVLTFDRCRPHSVAFGYYQYTAISRKVVGKRAHDNPERYCGWFRIHCYSKKFERMTREATEVCLRVLKESNKSRFDSHIVRNSVLIISHITFPRDCRVHILSNNLSRNSCVSLFSFQS